MPVENLMILAGIAFGVYCVYTDIKFGLIKNWAVLSMIGVAIAGHLLLFNEGVEELNPFLLIFIESIGFGFFLWYFRFISSGDAKLFWAICSIIPLSFYEHIGINAFPIQCVLVNSFVPILILLLGHLLYKTSREKKIEVLKQSLNPKLLASRLFWIFAVSEISGFIITSLGLPHFYLLYGLVMIGLMEAINKLAPGNTHRLVFLILFLHNLFGGGISGIETKMTQIIPILIRTLLMYVLLRYFVITLGKDVFTSEVKIDDLKEGMIPAERIFYSDQKYGKREVDYLTWFSPLRSVPENVIMDSPPDGLTEEDVNKVKGLYKEKKLEFDSILVHQQIPFAPALFLGFILTLLCKGNFLLYIFILK